MVLSARWTQPLNCHIGHESVGERSLLLHWGFGCLWGLEWCWLCDAQVWESSWWHRSPEVWMSWKESSVTWALVISYDSEKWKVMCVVDSALGPKAGNISCLHLAPTSLGVTFVLFFFIIMIFFPILLCHMECFFTDQNRFLFLILCSYWGLLEASPAQGRGASSLTHCTALGPVGLLPQFWTRYPIQPVVSLPRCLLLVDCLNKGWGWPGNGDYCWGLPW